MAEGTIQLPPDGTGKVTRTQTGGAAQPANTHQPVQSVAGPGGHVVDVRPDGLLKVTADPTTLFVDTFDGGYDSTNRWYFQVGTGTVTATAGALTASVGAVSGQYAQAVSNGTFAHVAASFVSAQAQATLPAAPGAAFHRFFGFGTGPATPTVAVPLTDAIGFAIKPDGFLYAVVWAAGVEVFSQRVDNLVGGIASASAMDGGQHRLVVMARSDRCFFFVDSMTAPAATTNFNTPAVSSLPVRFSIVNNAATAGTWVSGGITVADWGRNNQAISDPLFPWRRANVDVVGVKNALQVNLAGSASGVAQVTGGLTGTNTTVVANVASSGNVTIVAAGGTYTNLPIIFEATVDGLSWFPVDGARADGSGIDTATVLANNNANLARAWNIIATGYNSIRVRQTAAVGSGGSPVFTIVQGPFLFDPSPVVSPIDGQRATYSWSNTASIATAFTIGYLQGSLTKTVRITMIRLSGTATAAAVINVTLGRYSTAPTGGTPSTPAIALHDTINPAATAVPRGYSVAPTANGTLVAVVRTIRLLASTATTQPTIAEITFGNRPGQGLVLRGTSDYISIVPPAIAGGSWAYDFEWTEE